jgi:hypothetical protein
MRDTIIVIMLAALIAIAGVISRWPRKRGIRATH